LACHAFLFSASPVDAAGLLIADGPFGGVLEQTEHEVTVTINNGIAVTEVNQTFLNTENRTVEALYSFPVPEGASVANFSMWINGQEMIGEVLEKERARQVYNSYKQQERPKDPGLLEQVDYKEFELRIFPIFANAEQRIRITYYQQLNTDHDWSTYVYPLATTTKRGIDSQVTGRFAINFRMLSEVPISEVESPSHGQEFVFSRHDENFREASLEVTGGRGTVEQDVVLAVKTTRPQTGLDLITSRPEDEDGYFMMTLTAGEELEKLDQAMDYVFVLDVSGSMANDAKLRLSTASLASFIDALGPDDRFEVMTFNVAPSLLFSGLQTADDETKRQATAFLSRAEARGGTALRPALQTAMRYGEPDRPLNIVVLSDGMTEQADAATLLDAARQRPSNATIFTIGVGNEVNRPMLEQLAERSGGLADFISRGDNFERRAEAFRRKLLRPVASDLSFGFDGVEVYDVEPAVLPNLYHGTPVRVFGRYRGEGPVDVSLDATIHGRAVSKTTQLDFPDKRSSVAQHPQIERMWAWTRIDGLLKQADADGRRSRPVLEEVIRLGEAYSIVTEYTSFIVLENDSEYERWNIDRRNALRIDRDRAEREKVNERMRQLREASQARLGPSPTQQASTGDAVPPQAKPMVQVRDLPRDGDLNFVDDQPNRRRSIPSHGGGGGAIAPLGAAAMLGLLGAGAWLRPKRKNA
jgi:Ca-activated chloride channel family protein